MIKVFTAIFLFSMTCFHLNSKSCVFLENNNFWEELTDVEKNEEILRRLALIKFYVEEAEKLPFNLETFLTGIYLEIEVCRNLAQRD
jgi:hypothetical protein